MFVSLSVAISFLAIGGVADNSPNYLFTFGDSYSNTDFNPSGPQPSAQNPLGNPPYPGHTTAGGPNWVAYLATEYRNKPLRAYNFAINGSVVDKSLVNSDHDLIGQVGTYQQYYGDLAAIPGRTADNSIAVVFMGINDVGGLFLGNDTEKAHEMLPKVVGQYMHWINQISHVNQVAVVGVPPMNRTPTLFSDDDKKIWAGIIDEYNSQVQSGLKQLSARNPHRRIVFIDSFRPFNEALDHPQKYGAKDAFCQWEDGKPDTHSCLWWNFYHPASVIHKLLAASIAEQWHGRFISCHSSPMCP